MLAALFDSVLSPPRVAESRADRYALVRRADRVASRALWVSVATLAEAEALAESIPPARWDREGWDIMRQDSAGRLYALAADDFAGTPADQTPAAASTLAGLYTVREVPA